VHAAHDAPPLPRDGGTLFKLCDASVGACQLDFASGDPRLKLGGAASFRVANVPTLALGLVGGSLALSRFERHRFAATMLGGIAGATAVFALLGYLTGIDTLYSSASVCSPALLAAVGLLCVAGGIVFRIGAMPALRKPRPLWHLLVMLGCAIVCSCCSAHRREFASPTRSSIMSGRT
jgi:hypothetical protein